MLRKRNLYDPDSNQPFALSRTKIEDFIRCPRCFYLDRRLGVGRPPGFPFNLNSAVDELLKREFDAYRAGGAPHPYMVEAGIDAIPANHPQLADWRQNFKGVRTLHEPTNLEIFGAIDDLWVDANGNYIVVDYKATSKKGEVSLDADWQMSYKRQMEIYQWLLRKNGLGVSNRCWFVYCNGRRDTANFDEKIDFDVRLLSYEGNDQWVESALSELVGVLKAPAPPQYSTDCEYCEYQIDAANSLSSINS
jgi:RecB family exonuclease